MSEIIYLFHHIHHNNGEHEVHHCGGDHQKNDPITDYNIEHCSCRKHRIDKEEAFGHTISENNLEQVPIKIKFKEACPDGGWHIESGEII